MSPAGSQVSQEIRGQGVFFEWLLTRDIISRTIIAPGSCVDAFPGGGEQNESPKNIAAADCVLSQSFGIVRFEVVKSNGCLRACTNASRLCDTREKQEKLGGTLYQVCVSEIKSARVTSRSGHACQRREVEEEEEEDDGDEKNYRRDQRAETNCFEIRLFRSSLKSRRNLERRSLTNVAYTHLLPVRARIFFEL